MRFALWSGRHPVAEADKLLHSKSSVEIRQFEYASWPSMAAALVQSRIDSILRLQEQCSVMLTGGRNAERLYGVWSEFSEFQLLKGVRFYFGDERCVPRNHPESNYGMVMKSLFGRGIPPGCSTFPMDGTDPDRDAAARRYDKVLPDNIDLLLLGVGEDGHIASLFPGSPALHEKNRRVMPVVGPKLPNERLTITPPVINHAGEIFVLAAGATKAAVLSDLIAAPGDDVVMRPARLVIHANWLLDTALPGITHAGSQERPCQRY